MNAKLRVQNLGKSYRKWNGEWRRIASWFFPFISSFEEAWVLKSINFSISAGEAVGIVGQNGAGKSTLLKLITGTIQPTEGKVQINGSVSAILELGMGFNPDLTGRQNAIHSAGLMGYSPNEIEMVMPDIEDFSEIGDYFDKPVRTYSSGMQMRVAFSVATAFKPDILIIDEVMSVGDAYFQHKSFEKIREFRRQGTTLLMVSHDKGAIQSVCNRAILIDAGSFKMDGPPELVMDLYNAMIADKDNATARQQEDEVGKVVTISGSGEATIEKAQLLNEDFGLIEVVNVGQKVRLRIYVSILKNLPELVVGFIIKDRLGQHIFGTNTHHANQTLFNVDENSKIYFDIIFNMNLGVGTYSIAAALHTKDTHILNNYEWRDMLIIFNVINQDKTTFIGSTWIPSVIESSYYG